MQRVRLPDSPTGSGGSRSRYREGEGKTASMSGLTLDTDAAAMRFDDPLHDRESEADAAARRFPRLPEPVEDVRQFLGRDARTRVANGEFHRGFTRRRADLDASILGSELDGVATEVREDLQEPLAVGGHRRKRGRELRHQ